jgi:hypothetical protein
MKSPHSQNFRGSTAQEGQQCASKNNLPSLTRSLPSSVEEVVLKFCMFCFITLIEIMQGPCSRSLRFLYQLQDIKLVNIGPLYVVPKAAAKVEIELS